MKIFMKCLAVVLAVVTAAAVYDSLVNGLFSSDGYKPVTEQLYEIKSPQK